MVGGLDSGSELDLQSGSGPVQSAKESDLALDSDYHPVSDSALAPDLASGLAPELASGLAPELATDLALELVTATGSDSASGSRPASRLDWLLLYPLPAACVDLVCLAQRLAREQTNTS